LSSALFLLPLEATSTVKGVKRQQDERKTRKAGMKVKEGMPGLIHWQYCNKNKCEKKRKNKKEVHLLFRRNTGKFLRENSQENKSNTFPCYFTFGFIRLTVRVILFFSCKRLLLL